MSNFVRRFFLFKVQKYVILLILNLKGGDPDGTRNSNSYIIKIKRNEY